MLLDLGMNHQIHIYCRLFNNICEHGKNLEKKMGAINNMPNKTKTRF